MLECELTAEERKILTLYRKASPEKKAAALALAEAIINECAKLDTSAATKAKGSVV